MALAAYRARYVFPVAGPPIAEGVVTVAAGRVVSVGAQAARGAPIEDLGGVAIIPGLVNAHTHLQFSDLRQPLGHQGIMFSDWIRLVVALLRSGRPDLRLAVAQGLTESRQAGVTAIGDIASPGWVWPGDVPRAPGGVVYHELIGLARERVASVMARARELLAVPPPAPGWLCGLSPHAPYTVHPQWLAEVAGLASAAGVPLAMHLAESPEELRLLDRGDGPLVDVLRELDAWEAAAIPRGSRPLDYLQVLARAPRALVIHGNYLDAEELAFLATHRDRMAVVYCPRTHAYFGHRRYPLPELLAAGAAVALGTDSRASTPDLDAWAELQCVAATFPELPRWRVLELGTRESARALGYGDRGVLAPGARADLAAAVLPDRDSADPYELLFDARTRVAAMGPR